MFLLEYPGALPPKTRIDVEVSSDEDTGLKPDTPAS
jgi:hypothetical protein